MRAARTDHPAPAAPCPGCGAMHERREPSLDSIISSVGCECGQSLHYVVPLFAVPFGGVGWWGWANVHGDVGWDTGRVDLKGPVIA